MRGLMIGAALAVLAMAQPGAAQQRKVVPPETLAPLPARLVSASLDTFASEAEFRRYLRDVKREAKRRKQRWVARGQGIQLASLQEEQPCATPEDCPMDESVVVSASRVSKPSNPAITNTQERGVDEGDIVKQIGQYLLVLQDGRIFAIDTKAASGLALTDRINVYRDEDSGAWYDEMLVQGDRIVVTAYSYEEDATELSVFRLSPQGRFERQGVFLISSDDYYDSDNYATRLVGDSLVVYSPMWLDDVDPDEKVTWPLVRRWRADDKREKAGKPLFDARRVHRPVQPTTEPVIHTVSVCPLGPAGRGGELECRTTAFVGPPQREFYVTPRDAWLWVTPGWSDYDADNGEVGDCDDWTRRAPARAHPAGIYRIDLATGEMTVAGAEGLPVDQFSLAVAGSRLHALVRRIPIRCTAAEAGSDLALVTLPFTAFSPEFSTVSKRASRVMPDPGVKRLENRFTDTHLVYGGRDSWGSYPPGLYDDPDDPKPNVTSIAVAVPLRAPEQAARIALPHNVIRIERIGDDIVTTGYRDATGLQLSVIDLRATPRLADTLLLPGRFESEGRSHAFNSLIEPDGSGLMGLPTVARKADSGRWWWRSDQSDVSFMALDANRKLKSLGELAGSKDAVHKDYECDVSCVDWYGNSRPIFTDGRVFALADAELIEGRIEGGRIVEVRRVNITAPHPKR